MLLSRRILCLLSFFITVHTKLSNTATKFLCTTFHITQLGHIKIRLYNSTCHSTYAPMRVSISRKETGPGLTCQVAWKKSVWASRKPPWLADGELLIVCSDILRRWCITLGFKFSPNAQPMHNLCSYHQKVVAKQTKEVSRSFLLQVFTHQQAQSWVWFYSNRSESTIEKITTYQLSGVALEQECFDLAVKHTPWFILYIQFMFRVLPTY